LGRRPVNMGPHTCMYLVLGAAVMSRGEAQRQQQQFQTSFQDYDYSLPAPPVGRQPQEQQKQQTETTTAVAILKQINEQNDDGSYTYGYEAADGTFKLETRFADGRVQGKYGYIDANGDVKIIEYGADAMGFQPEGDLPEGIVIPEPVQGNCTDCSYDYDYPELSEEEASRTRIVNRARTSTSDQARSPTFSSQPRGQQSSRAQPQPQAPAPRPAPQRLAPQPAPLSRPAPQAPQRLPPPSQPILPTPPPRQRQNPSLGRGSSFRQAAAPAPAPAPAPRPSAPVRAPAAPTGGLSSAGGFSNFPVRTRTGQQQRTQPARPSFQAVAAQPQAPVAQQNRNTQQRQTASQQRQTLSQQRQTISQQRQTNTQQRQIQNQQRQPQTQQRLIQSQQRQQQTQQRQTQSQQRFTSFNSQPAIQPAFANSLSKPAITFQDPPSSPSEAQQGPPANLPKSALEVVDFNQLLKEFQGRVQGGVVQGDRFNAVPGVPQGVFQSENFPVRF